MARIKLMARKHVRAPPCSNVVPTESHSDGQDDGYFLRTLWTVLLTLGSSEHRLFIGTLRLRCGNPYLLHVRVVIYERTTIDHIHYIHQVVETPAPRWTFEASMREAAREALIVLRHEVDEQMAHPQYRHFPSRAGEGVEAVILQAGGHDHMGCFTDQVKRTHVLVGEHEEESSQKITELVALCKKLREDTQRLEEEKATLEDMAESRDELLIEIARETGLNRMGEDEDEEEEEEDVDDGGEATAPPTAAPPPPMPLATVPEEVDEEGPVEVILEQEAPMPHEVILEDVEPEVS
jgi:hypothetical protein